ncbi:translation initiation factor IF-2 subunit gamma [Candidatus Woesearchaeota archaeon]|nr:translation initiation factor IF-2 subunit gamma [Candidatus Woesearchaeota archaeon]
MARKKKDELHQEPEHELNPQPVLNIGMVGHVDHGKTTLLERLSGKWTDTHSEELKRGITIRLGYANVTFRKCPKCDGAKAYTIKEECLLCKSKTNPLRKASFVDAPGHESLMATMLAGATIMDGALLIVAANEECPQPQTREHLVALQIIGLKHIIVVQNKIDLVSEEQSLKNHEQIKNFLKGTQYENAPIIPISAQHRVGLDFLMQAIDENIPTPARDSGKDPIMLVARSFDINKPGITPEKMVGGVLGGSIKQGTLKVNDLIEIKPGRNVVEKNQQMWKPLATSIIGLNSGSEELESVGPSGSIGLLTSLDPSVVKSDQLTGSVVGLPGKLPPVWNELVLEIHLLQRVVGTKDELNVEPIKLAEPLMLNVNSAATVGVVIELKKNKIKCRLKLPVCADAGSRVTISRRIGNRFRLIGYGEIREK